jgi:hypothetical protein
VQFCFDKKEFGCYRSDFAFIIDISAFIRENLPDNQWLSGEGTMKSLVLKTITMLLALASVCAAFDPSQEIKYIGRFSDMRFTEEHQYGNEVELWMAGKTLVGFLLWSQGSIGDTPTGTVENVSYDPQTGKLSFTSKLTTGSHYCKVHHDVPSQDLFKFKGTLTHDSLSGELLHLQALDENNVISKEQIVLKRMEENQASGYQKTTYSKFKQRAKSILEFRGPKW